MIILKILLPIGFSLYIGGAYAAAFKKRFGESLMMAYSLQILLLLLSGMVFHNLLVGIGLEGALALLGWGYAVRSNGNRIVSTFRNVFRISSDNLAVPGFVVLALAVFAINYGKVYAEWDEFSHWGRFLEECCRLNQLYVMSPAGMAHKDYVPAVTLFEYLWCKLSLAYSEANAYRGIQMLLVAIALHLAERANFSENRAKKLLQYVFTVFVFMGIPVFFASWPFYHSIYEDAIFGILMFYASWVAMDGHNYGKYHSWIVLVSLSVLILSKMTAVPFVFMIWLLYLAAENCNGRKCKEHCLEQLLTFMIPAALWIVYNLFARQYVHVGGTQSYSGFTPALIWGF